MEKAPEGNGITHEAHLSSHDKNGGDEASQLADLDPGQELESVESEENARSISPLTKGENTSESGPAECSKIKSEIAKKRKRSEVSFKV